ncbi:MAG: class I SAM-dependent methyltransferase [Rubellimicrobium sp.]|nr:class I SAM-dependent methyltransferase [Rubellimicrobium sp.]
MARSRIATALDEGLFPLREGEVAVMRPPAGMDLAPLPRAGLRIIHTFRPDADYWEASGLPVTAEAGPAALAVVCLPRSKALGRGMVAEACRLAPMVVIDGQRENGVDSLWREMRERVGDMPVLAKAHGRLFVLPASEAFADWTLTGPVRGEDGMFTQPGVFSEGQADRGSALLARALPARLPTRMADLGAGWGYISRAVLAREGVGSLDLIEAEKLALDCARLNVVDPRAAFHWADVTRHVAKPAYDGIVMNPPFHQGRAAQPDLGRAFIAAAARMLQPSGQLWMVANRHLPYEGALSAAFRQVTTLAEEGGFKLFHATRPIGQGKR